MRSRHPGLAEPTDALTCRGVLARTGPGGSPPTTTTEAAVARALGVVGILLLGGACIYFWWRARRDDAYWKRVSLRTAAGGVVSLPFALAMTRRLWLLGGGLLLQGLAVPVGAYLDRLAGPKAENLARTVPLWLLLVGSALIFSAFIASYLARSRYEEVLPD